MPFSLDDLKLAFQLHVADRVVGADRLATEPEQDQVHRRFPPDELRRRGFLDPQGRRTPRLQEAVREALEQLPRALDPAARRELLQACYLVAVADRAFRIGEGAALLTAARQLGLSDDEFDAFLAEHARAVGMTAAVIDREP